MESGQGVFELEPAVDKAELDDLALAHLQSRATQRKVMLACSLVGLIGFGILAYLVVSGASKRSGLVLGPPGTVQAVSVAKADQSVSFATLR